MEPAGAGSPVNTPFYDSLRRRYVGAGLLITDETGQILLVNPTYKPGWEVPGGSTDARETPPETARRECLEELGLAIKPGRLLVLDHQWQEGKGDSTMYIYDGGTLTAQEAARIVLPPDELSQWEFVPVDQLDDYLQRQRRLANRLRAAHLARDTGATIELENGGPRS